MKKNIDRRLNLIALLILLMLSISFIFIGVPKAEELEDKLSTDEAKFEIKKEPMSDFVMNRLEVARHIVIAKFIGVRKIKFLEHDWSAIKGNHFQHAKWVAIFQKIEMIKGDIPKSTFESTLGACDDSAKYGTKVMYDPSEQYILLLTKEWNDTAKFYAHTDCHYFIIKDNIIKYIRQDWINKKIEIHYYDKKEFLEKAKASKQWPSTDPLY